MNIHTTFQNLSINNSKLQINEIIGHSWYKERENTVMYFKVKFNNGSTGEVLYDDDRIKLNTYISYIVDNPFDVAYVRKSRKAEQSISLQMQINAIANNVNDLDNLVVLNEGFRSGFDISKQKKLWTFIMNIKWSPKTRYVYVYDISRFTRDAHGGLEALNDLAENNYIVSSIMENLEYINDNDNHENVNKRHQFITKLNDAERDLLIIQLRARENVQHRRNRGDYIGRPPYGKKIQKVNGINKLVSHPDEEYNLRTINKYKNTKSCNQILTMLRPCKRKWTIAKLKRYYKQC